jgi:hypothetical protein
MNLNPHPRFDDAVAALDYGDLERLQGLIALDPALVQALTNLEPPCKGSDPRLTDLTPD